MFSFVVLASSLPTFTVRLLPLGGFHHWFDPGFILPRASFHILAASRVYSFLRGPTLNLRLFMHLDVGLPFSRFLDGRLLGQHLERATRARVPRVCITPLLEGFPGLARCLRPLREAVLRHGNRSSNPMS